VSPCVEQEGTIGQKEDGFGGLERTVWVGRGGGELAGKVEPLAPVYNPGTLY